MQRLRENELMDDPGVDRGLHEHALAALNRINNLLGAHGRLYRDLARLGNPRQASMVDLGAGGGGFLGYVARRRGQEEHALRGAAAPDFSKGGPDACPPALIGVDISHFALTRALHWQGSDVQGIVGDVHRLPLADRSIDLVTCQLLLHHFDEPEVVVILREAARVARRGVVIADLTRSRLATHAVSRSPIFHQDGPRSVRAAYRPRELAALAEQAGLAGASVRSIFPFRMVLIWRKP